MGVGARLNEGRFGRHAAVRFWVQRSPPDSPAGVHAGADGGRPFERCKKGAASGGAMARASACWVAPTPVLRKLTHVSREEIHHASHEAQSEAAGVPPAP